MTMKSVMIKFCLKVNSIKFIKQWYCSAWINRFDIYHCFCY